MKVFIGVDPHKLSATIEVVDEHERVLAALLGSRQHCGRSMSRPSYPVEKWHRSRRERVAPTRTALKAY